MNTYEDYSQSPDVWNVSCTLELEDDGRFSYSEGRTDYTSASLSVGRDGVYLFSGRRLACLLTTCHAPSRLTHTSVKR